MRKPWKELLHPRDPTGRWTVGSHGGGGFHDLGRSRNVGPRIAGHRGRAFDLEVGPTYRIKMFNGLGTGEVRNGVWTGKTDSAGNAIMRDHTNHEFTLYSGREGNMEFILQPTKADLWWDELERTHPLGEPKLKAIVRALDDGNDAGAWDMAQAELVRIPPGERQTTKLFLEKVQDDIGQRHGLPGLREVSAEQYADAFDKARKNMSDLEAAHLTPYKADDFKNMRCFLAYHGTVGGAVKPNGDHREGVALFNAGGARGAGGRMLDTLVNIGGVNQLDCIGPVLPKIYAKHGFEVHEVMKWDWQYAPDGWKKKWGEPDVVVMRRRQ